MITVSVIIWYADGNQLNANIKPMALIINNISLIYVKIISAPKSVGKMGKSWLFSLNA